MPKKQTRKRIIHGQLVRSTNEIQQECIRELHIVHTYEANSYKRISRTVKKNNDEHRG